MASKLLIRNTQSPGDIVVLSAAIRDLHLRHPGKFDVSLSVSPGAEHVYYHNPYIKKVSPAAGRGTKGTQFVAHYPLIKQCNQQRKHFLWGFIEHMNNKLHTDIKLTDFRPDLHVSAEEIAQPLIQPPYWVFLSGGKTDFRTKIWSQKYWEQVVASTKGDIRWVQCGGGSKNHIMHEKISGVHAYMVKQTKLRDFIRLIYHADGVVCVVTAAMHIAAAFNKPCVVIAGGREPWWWEAYTNENRLVNMRYGNPRWQIPANDDYVEHTFLHTMNQLSCCKNKGCWKSKLNKPASGCKNIVEIGGQKLPKCKAMITPDMVINSVFDYYKKDMVVGRKTIVPKNDLSAVYCLYGDDADWRSEIEKFIPEKNILVISSAVSRIDAIKQALCTEHDWLFWFEAGSMPATDNWLRLLNAYLSASTVKGRIYRTKSGQFYPHPSCFIGPKKLLNKDANDFLDLFSELDRNHFTPLGDEIQLPARRPCLTFSDAQDIVVAQSAK